MKTFKQFTEEKKKCGEGEYYCFNDKKCKPIPKGYRIGYGGGYYDRTIEYLEKKNEILKLGIAFDEQEIMKIPKEKYDKKLDIIVTPTRLII